jgi:hypothetical protein
MAHSFIGSSDFIINQGSFLYTGHAALMGSPLSPRQRYVRLQSGQADNQGFSGGGILHLSRFHLTRKKNYYIEVLSYKYRNNTDVRVGK